MVKLCDATCLVPLHVVAFFSRGQAQSSSMRNCVKDAKNPL